MPMDLLAVIERNMPGFSKGQKLIGRFITQHYDKAAFMTAAKLGDTVGVSESTVVRFATEVGFEGYPQLQKNLQEIIRNRLTIPEPRRGSRCPRGQGIFPSHRQKTVLSAVYRAASRR